MRSGGRLHRVFRRPGAGRPVAGLGRHVADRADAQGRCRAGVSGGVRCARRAAERARAGAARRRPRRSTPHESVCLPAPDGRAPRRARAVRDRGVRVHPLRSAEDSAARRLFHERHAGRHAHRSSARRHRPPVCGRTGGDGIAGRTRQGVLHRTADQGRHPARVGAGGREPAGRGAEGGRAAWRLRRDGARSGAWRDCLLGELQP